MWKYNILACLTMLVIACLQGYYISLQYNEYVTDTMNILDEKLKVAIDRDQYSRSETAKHTKGQLAVYHIASKEENVDTAQAFRLDTVNVDRLRRQGIANTFEDVLALALQDIREENGHPLDIDSLKKIYEQGTGRKFKVAILLLDSDKRLIKSTGYAGSGWYPTRDFCVSLKSPRFIRAMVDIPLSDFIKKSIYSLVLSLLFSFLVIASVSYQLVVIRRKEKLLKARELTINGTIHDLKSPLNSAITLLKYLQLKVADKTMKDLLAKVTDRIGMLVVDIETLLLTARGGEKRQIALRKESAQLSELAQKARMDVDTTCPDKPHCIEIEGDASAMVDRMYMENVFRNLMENAVKYADDGVKVKVMITGDDRQAHVTVTDNGWGIPRRDLKKIFNQFYRAPMRQAPRGYGIGLAFVRYVVEAHGGHIGVKSEPGKGSDFYFIIPENRTNDAG